MLLTKKDLEGIERFRISLPGWYHRRLMLWSFVKGTNRADLASKILQARIEANWELVNQQLDDIASTQEISREELEKIIFKDEEE